MGTLGSGCLLLTSGLHRAKGKIKGTFRADLRDRLLIGLAGFVEDFYQHLRRIGDEAQFRSSFIFIRSNFKAARNGLK